MTVPVGRPLGPLFCIVDGSTRGRSGSSAGVRVEFRRLAAQAGGRGASRRTSCATRTPSSSPAKASRSTSSSANSSSAQRVLRECEVLPAGTGSRTPGAWHGEALFHGMQT